MKKMKKILILNILLVAAGLCASQSALAHMDHEHEQKEKGMLYVLGMGPSGPELTSPKALEILQSADAVLGHPRHIQESFDEYLDKEQVAFNPWEGIHGGNASEVRESNHEKWEKRVEKMRNRVQDFAMQKIKQGKTVAIMDSGDPCVYAPSLYFLLRDFPREHMEIIPGMSAFNAASAALEQSMTSEGARFVMLTSPRSLFGDKEKKDYSIFKDLSKYDSTMVFYMALEEIDTLTRKMKEHYPNSLPAAIVYYAGYPDKEKVVRGTLDTIAQKEAEQEESWLGLLIIGKPVGK